MQPHERRGQPEIRRNGPKQRLEHPQVDDVGMSLGRAHDPRVAHRRREGARRGVDEPRDGILRGLGGGLALLVANEHGVPGRREGGCEPAQVGHGAAAEDRLLDDSSRQPPGAHRRAGRPVALDQEVGHRGQHLQAAHLDAAVAVPHGNGLRQAPERVGEPHVPQQVGPAAGGQRRHGVVAEERLLNAPGDVRQLQRRAPGH